MQETHLTQSEVHNLKINGWKTMLYETRAIKKSRHSYSICNLRRFQANTDQKRHERSLHTC